MDSASILTAVWSFSIAANIAAALRLYRFALSPHYRWFWVYLLVQAIQSLFLFFLPLGSAAYFWAHVLTEPLLWILYVLIVRELYSAVFERYQGIFTVTRWSMYAAWTIAIFISVLTLVPAWRSNAKVLTHLYYFQIVERGVVLSLALFFPLVLFFLSRYPIRLHRNTVVHCVLYSILFLTDAGVLLVHTMSQYSYSHAADILLIFISGCCYAAWALLLTREGEVRDVTVRHRANPAEEARLLQQLNAMNQTLLHVIRR